MAFIPLGDHEPNNRPREHPSKLWPSGPDLDKDLLALVVALAVALAGLL